MLEVYRIGMLERAIAFSATGMITACAWYALAAQTARIHGSGIAWTLPWALLGTLRYLVRIRGSGGGDPAEELLRGPLLAGSVAGWLATVHWLIG